MDVEIGETLKKKIDKQIHRMRKNDPELKGRIESERIHMLRVQITKWAAEACNFGTKMCVAIIRNVTVL